MSSRTTSPAISPTNRQLIAWTNLTPDGSLVEPSLPRDAYWASGHDGQKLFVVPSKKLVVVRLGFSPSADDIRTEALVADVIKTLG